MKMESSTPFPDFRSARVDFDADSDGPGLLLLVVGDDRTRVEGLATRLISTLGRWGHGPSWYERAFWWLPAGVGITLFLVLGSPIADAVGLGPKGKERWSSGEVAATVMLPVIFVALVAIIAWVTPSLQLLAPGGRTRFRRFRAAIVTFVGAVLATLVGGIVYGLVHG